LLTKEDFGIVGFATVAISYLAILKDIGLGAALIQRRDNVEEASKTVFTLNLLVGLILTLTSVLIAPFVAEFFREPLIIPILRVLGLSFAITSLGSVHIVRLQREMDFRRKLIPDLGQSIAKGVVAISLALTGAGVWSLVFGQLAGAVASVVLAWIVYPWRPRLSIDSSITAPLLRYGMAVIGIDSLTVITDNMDYLLVGRIFGDTALGVYTMAYRLPELLIINVLWVMGAVVFPAYSAIQDQMDELRQIFLTTIRIVEILVIPLCLGLFITADPLVRVAFGEKWLETIPILRVLSIYAWILSIGFHAGGVYKAIGRPDISVKLSLLNLAMLAPALLFGSRYGLIGIALAHMIIAFLRTMMRLIVANRYISISIGDILLQMKPAILGGISLASLATPVLYLTSGLSPLPRLFAIALAGAAGYFGSLWLVERESLLGLGQMIGVLETK
jgi:PST family polysaccharide transporter